MSSSVIVALDFESETEALALVSRLGQDATCYKVGLQLLIEAGPSLIRHLVSIGKQVFLDLKLHEIPHSVAAGVKAAGKLGAAMVTVHASGGSEVLRAAVAAAKPFAGLQVLALTVVTSLTDKELPEIGLAPSVQAQVERLAKLSAEASSSRPASICLARAPMTRHAVPRPKWQLWLARPTSSLGGQSRVRQTPQRRSRAP